MSVLVFSYFLYVLFSGKSAAELEQLVKSISLDDISDEIGDTKLYIKK